MYQKCNLYLPRFSTQERLACIRSTCKTSIAYQQVGRGFGAKKLDFSGYLFQTFPHSFLPCHDGFDITCFIMLRYINSILTLTRTFVTYQSVTTIRKTEIQVLLRLSSIKFQNLQDPICFSRTFQVLEKWNTFSKKDLWPTLY